MKKISKLYFIFLAIVIIAGFCWYFYSKNSNKDYKIPAYEVINPKISNSFENYAKIKVPNKIRQLENGLKAIYFIIDTPGASSGNIEIDLNDNSSCNKESCQLGKMYIFTVTNWEFTSNQQISLQAGGKTLVGFLGKNNDLTIVDKKGIVYIFELKNAKPEKIFALAQEIIVANPEIEFAETIKQIR